MLSLNFIVKIQIQNTNEKGIQMYTELVLKLSKKKSF